MSKPTFENIAETYLVYSAKNKQASLGAPGFMTLSRHGVEGSEHTHPTLWIFTLSFFDRMGFTLFLSPPAIFFFLLLCLQAPQVPVRLLRLGVRSEHAVQPDARVHRRHGACWAGYRSKTRCPGLGGGEGGEGTPGRRTAIAHDTIKKFLERGREEKMCLALCWRLEETKLDSARQNLVPRKASRTTHKHRSRARGRAVTY